MATGLYIGSTPIGRINVGVFSSNGYDTSKATAAAADILTGKIAFNASGEVRGTMPDNGNITKRLDTTTTSYTIPNGRHGGSGVVSIALEEITVTPTTYEQVIVPSSGKVISKIIVAASSGTGGGGTGGVELPALSNRGYASDLLNGKQLIGPDGSVIIGTMADYGVINKTLNGLTETSFSSSDGYYSSILINFDDSEIIALIDAI